jgi:hypothetical protein
MKLSNEMSARLSKVLLSLQLTDAGDSNDNLSKLYECYDEKTLELARLEQVLTKIKNEINDISEQIMATNAENLRAIQVDPKALVKDISDLSVKYKEQTQKYTEISREYDGLKTNVEDLTRLFDSPEIKAYLHGNTSDCDESGALADIPESLGLKYFSIDSSLSSEIYLWDPLDVDGSNFTDCVDYISNVLINCVKQKALKSDNERELVIWMQIKTGTDWFNVNAICNTKTKCIHVDWVSHHLGYRPPIDTKAKILSALKTLCANLFSDRSFEIKENDKFIKASIMAVIYANKLKEFKASTSAPKSDTISNAQLIDKAGFLAKPPQPKVVNLRLAKFARDNIARQKK